MIHVVEVISSTVSSPIFLLVAILLAFSVKIYFLSILIPQGLRSTNIQKSWFFLLGFLIGSMFGDIAWIIKLTRELWAPHTNYALPTFFIRIAWGFLIIQYQSLALFIESLSEKNFKLRTSHKVFTLIGTIFSIYFFYIAFFDNSLIDEFERAQAKTLVAGIPLEISIMRYLVYYLFSLILMPSLYVTFKKLRFSNVPKILKKQLRTFIQFLIFPYVLIEFLQAAHFLFKFFGVYVYTTVSVSTLLLIYVIYYCMQRVMGLRFLNFHSHVQSEHTFNFIDDFKNVFEQLGKINSAQELDHIVQTFFKEAFHIPVRKTMICIRANNTQTPNFHRAKDLHKLEDTVEQFMNGHDSELCLFIHKQKILIYDEIDFTHFYNEDPNQKKVLDFLEGINADVFLPIYDKQRIAAYIIIERHTRIREFYSNIERDQMLVFANYLSNTLNLLQHQNIEPLIHEAKELREELASSRQTINLYKESIRSFLRPTKQKEIGIIFYKNRRFVFGNQTAKELIQININKQEGHSLTQALKLIARQVEEYKSSQTIITRDIHDNKLVLCGVPNLEHSNVIITVYYPEISDIITKQITQLKDPSKWDYLLYLETTQTGQLINHMVPGYQELLLHFKFDLLKVALSTKATLLEFPEDDVLPAVELLHRTSNREILFTLNLATYDKNTDTSIKLFGVNPIFGNSNAQPLFKKLDNNGTLYIKNVEFLHLETQEMLADYLKTGEYCVTKSDQKINSNVRVICSTQQNLQMMVHDNTFSKSLFEILHATTVELPPLSIIPEKEFLDLIHGFTEQLLKTQAFKSLLELSPQEKNKLLMNRPASLHELKNKIYQALILKSKKNQIYNETQFSPAYAISDPELTEASNLGKHALRDPKIMSLLWNKFKNQNQIAAFLGVNRSSVNRRCKDYNLA
ncbi:MAG: sigma 54-interacting transcriptional regulator [Candidatus Dependentiae bacterium]|nr:sigma 54-interacting transcriptional regulator [Candidatus Dependentiae bacterium]